MDTLRNLPPDPASLSSLIAYQPGSVVSMTLSRHPTVQMTLFAFAEGEGISAQFYPGDTLYLVAEGQMSLRRAGETVRLNLGDCIRIPAGETHAIGGTGPFKLLQITLNPNS